MRFRILGPVRVKSATAGWVGVPADQQRVVLAVLLAEAGRAVSTDRLIDAVWSERPPRHAVNTMQAYVMRLRRLIGDDVVATRGHGYELVARPGDIDAGVFEKLLVTGRRELGDGWHQAACAKLRRGIGLWRGPTFAALTPQMAHLEQVRLSAEEDYVAAMLALDHHEYIVDDLSRLADRNPLRETRWVLLMRALHRCGRRGEALGVFHRARKVLGDELGIEPCAELQALQRTILGP